MLALLTSQRKSKLDRFQTAADFRAVTAAEAAHYKEMGWVKLPSFISRAQADALLAIAKERMGEAGDRNAPPQAFAR